MGMAEIAALSIVFLATSVAALILFVLFWFIENCTKP